MPEVVWWNGQRGSWCQAIVEFLTEGFEHRMSVKELEGDGAVVVVKADQVTDINALAADLVGLSWHLLIITANEDGKLGLAVDGDLRAVFVEDKGYVQRNFRMWLQTPHRHQTADAYLPWGWTPGCVKQRNDEKFYDWSFAGQITHKRRKEFFRMAIRLNEYGKNLLVPSTKFAGGNPQDSYYEMLSLTKVAPCPSGPVTVDSLRVCEALQLGAVPVLDMVSPRGPYPEYWDRVFGEHPLEMIYKWKTFPDQLAYVLENWETVSRIVSKWWANWKIGLLSKFYADLALLGVDLKIPWVEGASS